MKKIALLTPFFFAFFNAVTAQSTSLYWNLAGNGNATATSKLGTTNRVPLRFFTSNQERLRIDTSGKIGIGTTTPLNMLTVKLNGSAPASSWLAGGSSLPAFLAFGENQATGFNLATAADPSGYRPVLNTRRSRGTLAAPAAVRLNDYLASFVASGYDGRTFQNPATIDFYVDGIPSAGSVPGRISFVTGSNAGNRAERLKVGSTGDFNFNNGQLFLKKSNGGLGIGTTTPASSLNVIGQQNVSLTSPGYFTLGDTSAYNLAMDINVIQAKYRNTAASLYVNYYGGYTYLGPNGIVAISNTGVLTTGPVGINGSSNEDYALNVNPSTDKNGVNVTDVIDKYAFNATKSGKLAGVYVTKSSTSSLDACLWGFSTGSSKGIQGTSSTGIGVYGVTFTSASYAGYFAGNVFTTGNYLPSDLSLKKNVKEFTKAIEFIKQLHPKTYEYKDDGNYKLMNLPAGKRYGLIADDVEKILPGLVKQTKFETASDASEMKGTASPAIDFKAVNYTELIPIIIKAMQEQDIEKDEKIKHLQHQIDDLATLVQTLAKQGNTTTSLSTAWLKQNSPNPFNTNTVVSYYIPENARNAQIKITDVKGRIVKTFSTVKGEGQVNIRAGELPAGTYNYTLYINNNSVDSRQMVLLK